jgi:hypothetical protein
LPIAQAVLAEAAATPVISLIPRFGLDTWVQVAPFQCRIIVLPRPSRV